MSQVWFAFILRAYLFWVIAVHAGWVLIYEFCFMYVTGPSKCHPWIIRINKCVQAIGYLYMHLVLQKHIETLIAYHRCCSTPPGTEGSIPLVARKIVNLASSLLLEISQLKVLFYPRSFCSGILLLMTGLCGYKGLGLSPQLWSALRPIAASKFSMRLTEALSCLSHPPILVREYTCMISAFYKLNN